MKMKRVTVTWEKVVDAVVYVPEDMDDETIEDIARETAESIDRDGWEADWDTNISSIETLDVPDEECRLEGVPGALWRRPPVGSRFRSPVAMVTDDMGEEFVQPEDAKWWLAQSAEQDPTPVEDK